MTKEWQEAANEIAVEQKMDPFTVRAASSLTFELELTRVHDYRDPLRPTTRVLETFRRS